MKTKARVKGRSRDRAERAESDARRGGTYRGKRAKTGNSLGFRFERALFHGHPEFNGDVEARVIGPGRMLVIAAAEPKAEHAGDDPVLSSFMSFLASDIQHSPGRITSFDRAAIARAKKLVKGVKTSPDEDLGDEALI